MKKIVKNENGIALLLTIIILSIVTLIAVFIVSNVIVQLRLAKDINNSQTAIYAAESGVEWQLYQIRKGASVAMPAMTNGATLSVTVIGNYPNFTIKSLGSYQSVKRQFEITF